MTHRRLLRSSIPVLLAAACVDGGPTGSLDIPAIDFHIVAPATLPTKAVVEVETVVTSARHVGYPLTVVYEKANAGQPFVELGTLTIDAADVSRVSMPVPILMDPRIRVTVSEPFVRGLVESRTIEIDVLDFE